MTASALTLQEVADLVGGRLVGDAKALVRGIAPVDEAGPDQLGLLAARKYVKFVPGSRAAALLVSAELERQATGSHALVVVDDAHQALEPLLRRLHPPEIPEPSIHPTAVVGRGVRLGKDVALGPYCVVEDDVEIGDGCRVGAHVVVGRGSRLGDDCTLHPHVVLYPRTVLGNRVVVHSGTRLGVDGFGYTVVEGAFRKVPQVGRCVVGDDVEIGANTTIDRGSIGDTVLGEGSKLDNLIQLGHNVRLGARSILAAMVGIAGSSRLGRGVSMGGQAGMIGHLDIGDGARIAAAARVMRDVGAGETVAGDPARPNRAYLRWRAQLERFPEFVERLKALEKTVDALRTHG